MLCLKLVRGTASQKAFAAELDMHENSVSKAERRDSATQEYPLKLASARGINLHWPCLRAIGVTEDTLPATEALDKLLQLTIEVMRRTD